MDQTRYLVAVLVLFLVDIGASTWPGLEVCSNDVPDPRNCGSYFKCDETGKLKPATCGFLKAFDPDTRSCVWKWMTNCGDQESISISYEMEASNCTGNVKRPVPGECRKYFECKEGEWTLKSCPSNYFWDKYFNNKTLTCEDGESNCQPPATHLGSSCLLGERVGYPEDCRKYYECGDNSTWSLKTCPSHWYKTKNFDITSGTCVYFDATCASSNMPTTRKHDESSTEATKITTTTIGSTRKDDKTSPEGTKITTTIIPITEHSTYTTTTFEQTTATTASPMTAGGVCRPGDKKAIKGDCTTYFLCVNGQYRKTYCGLGMKFDTVQKTCLYYFASCA